MQQIEKEAGSGNRQASESVAQRFKGSPYRTAHFELPHHGKVFFFGVVLPIIAVLFETSFHFCARHFFDPFPTTNHVVLFLLIPLSNYLTLLASRRNLSAHYSFMTLASGMAMGMGAMYSLMFLPLLASSLLFIGAFGFGLLGLAPALSLPCTWIASKRVCQLSRESKTYFNPHQLEHIGHLIILVMVLAVELPSTLTRVYLGIAATPATEIQGVRWLRKYGSQEVMLRACYEHSGRATDIIGSLYESGHPLPVSDARRIFYRVTGKPFNSVPIPAAARATIQHALVHDPCGLNAKVEDEFDLDTDIAGETVSGVARGLSVSAANVNGELNADAMLAEIDWVIGFANVSRYDREARAKVLLPEGAVATRATLTVNGKEHEAKIMVREAARTYYREAVMQHKDDPLLVSTCGADQVLVQCYPVHPGSDLKVKLHIVCPLVFDKDGDGALVLPAFAEKNFAVNSPISLCLDSKEPLSISGLEQPIQARQIASGSKKKWQLTASLNAARIAHFAPLIHATRNHDCHSVFFRNTFEQVPVVIERRVREQHYEIPQKLTVLIDGSAEMKGEMGEIVEGLESLPPSVSTKFVLVTDEEATLTADSAKPGSPEYKRALRVPAVFRPAGGQDNSVALLKALDRAATEEGSVVLWLHASQPATVSGCDQSLKYLLTRGKQLNRPLLYDLQVSAGPVEFLGNVDNCSGFKRVPRTGSVSDDLRQLYKSWSPQPDSDSAEFVAHADFDMGSGVNVAGSGISQLLAYKRIISEQERPTFSDLRELNTLAGTYHLISPFSSAVVTDSDVELTPLPKPKPDPLSEFFSARTIEDAYSQISQDFNKSIDQSGPFFMIINPLNLLGGCGSLSGDQSSLSVNQLNRLNSVTSAGNSDSRAQQPATREPIEPSRRFEGKKAQSAASPIPSAPGDGSQPRARAPDKDAAKVLDREATSSPASDDYRGLHQLYKDDLVGNLWQNIGWLLEWWLLECGVVPVIPLLVSAVITMVVLCRAEKVNIRTLVLATFVFVLSQMVLHQLCGAFLANGIAFHQWCGLLAVLFPLTVTALQMVAVTVLITFHHFQLFDCLYALLPVGPTSRWVWLGDLLVMLTLLTFFLRSKYRSLNSSRSPGMRDAGRKP